MFLDRVLGWVGANTIADGVIVGKNHYSASVQTPSSELVGTKWVTTQVPSPQEGFSLMVRGKGKFGTVITQEIYVEDLAWSCAKVGDKWPIQ